MRRVTVTTRMYHKELNALALMGIVLGEGENDDSFFMHMEYEDEKIGKLYAVLIDIMLNENALTQRSERLKAFVKNAVLSKFHERNMNRLLAYMQENEVINLEGYVKFRMTECNDSINIMLYTLVKKMELY